MGSSLAAEGKLQFYPTQPFETHRLLGVLCRISIDPVERNYIRNNILDEETRQKLGVKVLDNNCISWDYVLYDYWLETKQYDKIKQYCKCMLDYPGNNPIVIADLFAGEGAWLDTFSTIGQESNCDYFVTIANELEENRYKVIADNPNIHDKYNKAFEELHLPKNSISLMLFNPPYSSSNGERNCKRYLRMIIERQLLCNPEKTSDYRTGYMAFVIRKDDFLDSLDLICQHFHVLQYTIYKTNPEEYAKYKQYIFIAQIRRFPYDFDKSINVMDFQKEYNNIKAIIESEPEFKLSMYETILKYPYIDYNTLKENYKYIETEKLSKNYISNSNDSIWKWIKEITELKDLGQEKLTIPKPLKLGELANIMASGYINGEISLNGEGKHIVIGGTKNIEKEEKNTYKDSEGKNVTETKVIKMSQPYLNVLCSEDGQLKIKELGSNDQ